MLALNCHRSRGFRTFTLLLALTLADFGWAQTAICGDCNMDGQITVLDALRGAQFAAGLMPPSPPTPADFVVCDVNNSAIIEILDALLMAQAAAGLAVVLQCPSGCGVIAPTVDADFLPLQTASPPLCRDLPIPFTLSDPESDVCDITVEFTTDAGTTWGFATEGAGSSGRLGLASSPFPGTAYVFIWDSVSDLGTVFHTNVQMRFTVMDCLLGNTDRSLPGFTVANDNTQPIVVLQGVAPPYAAHGTMLVDYFLFDNESDLCDLVAEVSTDGGASWSAAAQGLGGDGTMSLTSAMFGVIHTYAWDVDATFTPGWSSPMASLRLTPTDCGPGVGDTRVFPGGAGCLPGQTPPATMVTTPLSGMIFAGIVPFDFDVSDADSDLVDVVILYSTDNGISFPPGQVCTQFAGDSLLDIQATPGGVSRHFEWNASGDLGVGVHPNLRLQLTPADFCGAGSPEIAPPLVLPPFEVGCPPGGTTPPSVLVFTPLSGLTFSGTVPVDFAVIDADSHPVDILVEYSIDNGATFTTATLLTPNPIVGAVSSPGGTPLQVTWDTSVDLPGVREDMCRLRFSASDFCDAGVPVVAPTGGNPFIIDNSVVGFGPGVFVCNSVQSTIYFVSAAAPTVVSDTIVVGGGAAVFDTVIDPVTQNRLYALGENSITIIDANTHLFIDADPGTPGTPNEPINPGNMTGLPGGLSSFSPQQIEIAPDGLHLYMNVFNAMGQFYLVKLTTTGPPYQVLWAIPQSFFGEVQGEFALSPDGTRIVTMNNDNYDTDCGLAGCPQLQGAGCANFGDCLGPFGSFMDCCNTDSVSFVNTNTGTIINTISNMGNNPLWGAFNASGTKCYVSEFGYLDLCTDPIFCDILGEEMHFYDTSGASMSVLGSVFVPCPTCGHGGSTIQEGSFPSGVYRVPGRDFLYITDPANEAGKVCVFNTLTDMYESTATLPLAYYTPMDTGPVPFAPHHIAFDTVRTLAYIIELDDSPLQSRVRAINYSVGAYGAIDISKDTAFGDFGPSALSGLSVKE